MQESISQRETSASLRRASGRRPTAGRAALLAPLLLAASGCGSELVDVRARVLLDGEPLAGASVTLHGKGPTVSGLSDAEGRVRFTTYERDDGVLPGTYKVVVFKSPGSGEEESTDFNWDDDEAVLQLAQQSRGTRPTYTPTALPRIYLMRNTTPLSLTVPPAEEDVVFELDSTAGRPR